MCGIAGFYVLDQEIGSFKLAQLYYRILCRTRQRGKDSFGVVFVQKDGTYKTVKSLDVWNFNFSRIHSLIEGCGDKLLCSIANFRAEPTTERIKKKTSMQIQPFSIDNIHVAHNGIIYNDEEILAHGVVRERLKDSYSPDEKIIDSYAIIEAAMAAQAPINVIEQLKGSYAFALVKDGGLLLARNYRDLAVKIAHGILWFSSKPAYLNVLSKDAFDRANSIDPYSYVIVNKTGVHQNRIQDTGEGDRDKAVVICSGGLDSTTSATQACNECDEVTILHFKYGCLAQQMETNAVKNIVESLRKRIPGVNLKLEFIDIDFLKNLGGSTLIDNHNAIKSHDEGVETHSEWVPQRNLVMMALAGAYCDKHKIGKIYLGLNLEEAGAFPDNTTEFYELLEDTMNVGSLSRPEIINPCGNLVKHEIVALAHKIKAPIHLSWSCYRGGGNWPHNERLHQGECGECGPCTMKRIAMEINNLTLKDFEL